MTSTCYYRNKKQKPYVPLGCIEIDGIMFKVKRWKMTEIIATFRLNAVPDDMIGFSNDEINDMFKGIAQENKMELVSWGAI